MKLQFADVKGRKSRFKDVRVRRAFMASRSDVETIIGKVLRGRPRRPARPVSRLLDDIARTRKKASYDPAAARVSQERVTRTDPV